MRENAAGASLSKSWPCCRFTSKELMDITQNVVLVALIVSSVKTEKEYLNRNTLNVIIQVRPAILSVR